MEKHYKVRNRNSGSFHTGGRYSGKWNKIGKTFVTLGKLRAFLTRSFNDEVMRKDIPEYEIVELEVREAAVKQVHEVMDPKKFMALLTKTNYD